MHLSTHGKTPSMLDVYVDNQSSPCSVSSCVFVFICTILKSVTVQIAVPTFSTKATSNYVVDDFIPMSEPVAQPFVFSMEK